MNNINLATVAPATTNKSAHAIIFIWIILVILLIGLLTFLAFWVTTKKIKKVRNSTGYFVFLIDTNKARVKIANDDPNINIEPWFYKKSNLASGQWIKLDDFLNVYNSETKDRFLEAIQKNILTQLETEVTNQHDTRLISKVNINIDNYEQDLIYGTLYWQDRDGKEDEVFEPIQSNLSYLSNVESKYNAVLFILDIKNVYNAANFVALFKKHCVNEGIYGIKVFLDWNKLFFVFPHDTFGVNRATYAASLITEWSKIYIKLYSKIFLLDNSFFSGMNIKSMQIFIDYLKINYKPEKNYEPFKPNNNILDSYEYKDFVTVYKNISDWTNNLDLQTKKISVRNLQGQKSEMKEFIVPNQFNALGCVDNETLNQLDIYRQMFVNIYTQLKKLKPSHSALTLKDYIFNAIDFKKIAEAAKTYESFLQIIEFTSFKSINKIKDNVAKHPRTKYLFGLKINEINEDILAMIDPWVKIVLIDETLANRLNEPEILLYMNTLFEKSSVYNIKVIFDRLDYKSYRKVLYKHTHNILYTY
ncbi:MHO_4530 family protein [Metamycoplasma neophronis]|uniref:EAL domain-containing protein n=1 Tax=Metamycoplasma neophronis TaxID=872983 RepID=A0ABY2Z4Y2_9BACT|nr:hypothetical protein [Metamycoplasma neophronis]TPR53853.1 hypothetical protein FJR74_01660 [Metamycoplasma neophronis]